MVYSTLQPYFTADLSLSAYQSGPFYSWDINSWFCGNPFLIMFNEMGFPIFSRDSCAGGGLAKVGSSVSLMKDFLHYCYHRVLKTWPLCVDVSSDLRCVFSVPFPSNSKPQVFLTCSIWVLFPTDVFPSLWCVCF